MIDAISSSAASGPMHRGAPGGLGGGGSVLAAWLLSLAFHMLGLGMMLLIVFPFAASPSTSEFPGVIAQVVGEVDAVPSTPMPPDTARTSAQTPGPATPARITPNTGTMGKAIGLPGTAPQTGQRPDLSIIGLGGGGGEGGQLGLSLDTGSGVEFFGVGGSAPGVRAIVYVVDRSGSMVDTFRHVQAELKRSISALRRSQKFHVIFFNAADPLENPPQRLVNAIESHRQEFFKFLEGVTPQGGTKPERALRRALALEPDILYLLSDGINFDPDLRQKLDEWNKDRKTRIYTIAYLDQGGRQVLETIAREHNGEYKFVSDDELP